MSKNAATEEKLGSLHEAVADTLIEQLAGTPILDSEGEIVGRHIDPRIIAAAITFLNNNKVTMNPFLSEKVTEIEQRLAARRKRFKAVNGGAKEAAERAAAHS